MTWVLSRTSVVPSVGGKGLHHRLGHYVDVDASHHPNMAKFVKKHLIAGYTIACKGVLAYTKFPEPGYTSRCRARMLMLEGWFTIVFNACIPMTTDFFVEEFTL